MIKITFFLKISMSSATLISSECLPTMKNKRNSLFIIIRILKMDKLNKIEQEKARWYLKIRLLFLILV